MTKKNLIEKFEKRKDTFKKKHVYCFVFVLFLLFVIGIYWDNFTSNSSFLEKTNLISYFFGQKSFDIGAYYGFEISNETATFSLDIDNNGDKDIGRLIIRYSGCGVQGEEVSLNKQKLRIDDPPEKFTISFNPTLNEQCLEKNPKTEVQIYEDSAKQCYLLVPDSFKEFCNPCNVSFEVYDGEEYIDTQKISYSTIQFGHKENMKEFIEFVLEKYPLVITWNEGYNSTCSVIKNEGIAESLNKKEVIYLSFFNFEESCKKFPDSVFCLDLKEE